MAEICMSLKNQLLQIPTKIVSNSSQSIRPLKHEEGWQVLLKDSHKRVAPKRERDAGAPTIDQRQIKLALFQFQFKIFKCLLWKQIIESYIYS